MIESLLLSLSVTLCAELAAAWLLKLRSHRALAVVALMNVMTNPPLVFTLNLARKFIPLLAYRVLTAGLEAGAVLLEALVLRHCLDLPPKKALGMSVLLNLCSYCTGWLLNFAL